MDLYLVRHAIAFDADPAQWPDDRERPLTKPGAKKFARAAAGLRDRVATVDLVLSSPLARAWQTAEILTEQAKWPEAQRFEPLEPGRTPQEVIDGLQPLTAAGSIALVGHSPSLNELASYLLTTDPGRARLEMKKGGVAYLSFDAGPQAGSAILRWLLTPGVLRSIE
jgi:phosphohistidine phosphatase